MKTTFQMSCPLKEILRKAIKRTFVVSFIIIYFSSMRLIFDLETLFHSLQPHPRPKGKEKTIR